MQSILNLTLCVFDFLSFSLMSGLTLSYKKTRNATIKLQPLLRGYLCRRYARTPEFILALQNAVRRVHEAREREENYQAFLKLLNDGFEIVKVTQEEEKKSLFVRKRNVNFSLFCFILAGIFVFCRSQLNL